jgi:hypothetical protein
MSPLVFDLFIDSILDECKRARLGLRAGDDLQVPGLLFADDLVNLGNTPEELQEELDHVSAWTNRWGMQIGAGKCGVMAFGHESDGGPEEAMQIANDREWMLQGQRINVVSQYTYLGLEFTPELNLAKMSEARYGKGLKAYASLLPLLRNQTIPVPIRVRVLKAMLQPTLSYGGELFGLRMENVAKHQQVLSRAMRLIMGFGAHSHLVSESVLWAELDVAPFVAVVNCLRIRAHKKYPDARTVIGPLCKVPFKCKRSTWVTGTRRWVRRMATKFRMSYDDFGRLTLELVKEKLWKWREAAANAKSTKAYLQNEYKETVGYHDLALQNVSWGHPLQLVGRARMNAYLTAKRAADMRVIPMRHRTRCPFCDTEGREDITHILLECNAWEVERTRYLADLIDSATAALEDGEAEVPAGGEGGEEREGPNAHSKLVAVLLLGGKHGEISIAKWERSDREAAEGSLPPCIKVGLFLKAIENKRNAVFARLKRELAEMGPEEPVREAGGLQEREAGREGDLDLVPVPNFPPRGDAQQGMPGLFPAHAPALNGD